MQFNRSIGSIALLFSALGGIVGSGWLFGSLYAAQIAGPAAVLSWIIGGILMMVIAITFAELATTFPVAGGMVRFADYSHGPLMSFTIGWMVWLSSVVVAPLETMALLQYAGNYIPGIINVSSHSLTAKGILFATVVMLILLVLNAYGAKFFSRASTTIVAIKLIVPVVTLITLFALDFHASNFTSVGGFIPSGWHGVFAALPLGGVIFSFIGYSPAIQLAGEARNPQRAIPLAIIGSLTFCIFLYTLLQLAFVGSMKPEYLVNGWQHLSFSGDGGPFAGILAAFGITWLVVVIYADAIISPFGTAYIYTASTARVGYAMSETKFFPTSLHKLNNFGVPLRALGLNFVVGMLLFLPFPGWQSMVSFIISCFVISYIIGPIALMSLRKTHSDQKRTFRLPAAGFMTIVAFYVCNLLIYWTGWQTVSKLLIAIAIGFVVFFYRYFSGKFAPEEKVWQRAAWLFPYLIGVGVISYFGAFGGGKNAIPFGYDFIVIAVFSICAYYVAMISCKIGGRREIEVKVE